MEDEKKINPDLIGLTLKELDERYYRATIALDRAIERRRLEEETGFYECVACGRKYEFEESNDSEYCNSDICRRTKENPFSISHAFNINYDDD